MPKIKVTKHGGFKYGVGDNRVQYGKNEELIVKQKDARTLVAAKLAEYVDEKLATQTQIGTAPKSKGKTTAKATTRTATRKSKPVSAAGRYDRRDMRAK